MREDHDYRSLVECARRLISENARHSEESLFVLLDRYPEFKHIDGDEMTRAIQEAFR